MSTPTLSPEQKSEFLVNKFMKETNNFTGGEQTHSKIHCVRCATMSVELLLDELAEAMSLTTEPIFIAGQFDYWKKVWDHLQKM